VILPFVLGFLLGFIGSVPVAGPISALVVSRGVQGRFRSGAFIALGGGIAEAGYSFLAFWGFSAFLTRYAFIVPASHLLGAVILTVLGISFLRSKELVEGKPPERRESRGGSFVLGLTITIVNPTLIATWTAVVTTIYSTGALEFSTRQALPFALGSMVGIAGWFLLLLALIRAYRERFTVRTLRIVVRLVAVVLLGTAGWFAWRFVEYLLGRG
jgi:threonine/homoserine/homoserine lactone efflux protein